MAYDDGTIEIIPNNPSGRVDVMIGGKLYGKQASDYTSSDTSQTDSENSTSESECGRISAKFRQ